MLHIASRSSDAVSIAWLLHPQRIVDRTLVVGLEQELAARLVELAVRREAAEIEERRVEPGIVPIDQPELAPVIDEVAGQEIVVAEHQLDRSDAGLEPGRRLRPLAEPGDMAMTGFGQPVAVVAQHLENPESQHGTAQMARHLAVAAPDQRHDSPLHGALADIRWLQRPALDEVEDGDARLAVQHLGRDAGAGCRTARGDVGKAQQVVLGHVSTHPDDAAATAVLDDEILVGHAAAQRHRLDLAAPEGKAWRCAR